MSLTNAFARSLSIRPSNYEAENDNDYDGQVQHKQRLEKFKDIYHIIFVLRQRLNADIARLVLLEADYLDIYRERQRPIEQLDIMELNSPQTCFISQPIHTIARNAAPVRCIYFRFESRDQGWVTDPNNGSWSWFTASILPAASARQIQTSEASDTIYNIAEHSSIYNRHHPLCNDLRDEIVVYRNNLGCRHFETNTVAWYHDNSDSDQSTWVRSLRQGDRIVVRALARFAGWQNSVKGVSIEVAYAAVR